MIIDNKNYNINSIRYRGYTTFINENTNKMGIINKENSIIIEGFDYIGDFKKGGIAEFEKEGKEGFININGKILVENADMVFFNNDCYQFLTYQKNNKYSIINLNGEIILSELDKISNITNNGNIIFKKNGKEIFFNLIEKKEIKGGDLFFD